VSWEEEITCALFTDYNRMFRKSLLLQASDRVRSKSRALPLLFLLNDDAELTVARASQTGFEPLTRCSVADSATLGPAAISGNRVFIKDISSLTFWTLN
jgi:hypothetical protein